MREVQFRFLIKRKYTWRQKLLMFISCKNNINQFLDNISQLDNKPSICGQHIEFSNFNEHHINIYLPNFTWERNEENMIEDINKTINHEYLHESLTELGIQAHTDKEKNGHEFIIRKMGY